MEHLRKILWMSLLVSSVAFATVACGDDEDDGGGGNSGEGGEGGGGSGGAGGTSGGAGGTSGGAGGASGGAGGVSGGGAGGSTGGSGGSGGDGGLDAGDDDAGDDDDDDAGDEDEESTASATLSGIDDNEITGTVTFTEEGPDVTVVIELDNCEDGAYPVHIHEGADCANYGPHWDPPRGEGIPSVTCDNDHGEATYTRLGTDENPWSVDLGEEDTDVNGHTFVVHDPDTTVIGCGEIEVD